MATAQHQVVKPQKLVNTAVGHARHTRRSTGPGTQRQDWTRGYNAARRYQEREGHLDVPYEHTEGAYPLGR
ncbi:helicase associated domain-containing protein [Streptomyces yanii]|uniref:Helicase associated domain-containing protein n=1 Tax=Streptomyces yanii TaxID=78510 RepID=A0ABV5R6P8_9ACTN